MELPIVRTQKYTRWLCQEYEPERQAGAEPVPYGEEYEFWKISDVKKYSMNDMFRQEMRSLFDDLGVKVRDPLPEIVSLEERR